MKTEWSSRRDADFVNSFLLLGEPGKLLMIATGNITNVDLEGLLLPAMPAILNKMPAGLVAWTTYRRRSEYGYSAYLERGDDPIGLGIDPFS